MPWVVIRHARIGDEVREPGYVLSDDDLKGRDLRHMEQVDRSVKLVDDAPAKARRSRSRKPASDDE